MVKLILFDVDGVLINSNKDILEAANYALSTLGYPQKSIDEVATTFGLGTYGRFSLWIDNENERQKAVSIYREYYLNNVCKKTELYPNVAETIQKLKIKYKLGIVSNKLSTITSNILLNKGLLECFDVIVGSDIVKNAKPAPDGINYAISKLKISPKNTLMVGDSDVDVLSGKSAGTLTCGVTYGISDFQKLKGTNPNFFINSFQELLVCIDEVNKRKTIDEPIR